MTWKELRKPNCKLGTRCACLFFGFAYSKPSPKAMLRSSERSGWQDQGLLETGEFGDLRSFLILIRVPLQPDNRKEIHHLEDIGADGEYKNSEDFSCVL